MANYIVGDHVQNAAFHPSKQDTDGISLFRLDFVTPEMVVAAGTHANGSLCVCLRANALFELGLSVVPSRIDELSGHVVVPEMNIEAFKGPTKDRIKDFAIGMRLAAQKFPIWKPPIIR